MTNPTTSIEGADGTDAGDPHVEVCIVGVVDAATSATVRSIVRSAFRDHEMSGNWTAVLAPSETHGRWDLQLKGAPGRHVLSLTATPKSLPDVLSMNLKRTLERLRGAQEARRRE